MSALRLLEYLLPRREYPGGLPTVTLTGRDVLQGAVTVLLIVPVHEPIRPILGRLKAREAGGRVFGTVLERPEERLGISVVVAGPRAAVGARYAQPFKRGSEGGGLHGASVVGVEDLRIVAPPQSLLEIGFGYQLLGAFARLLLVHFPSDYAAAVDVHYHVEVVVHAAHGRF